VLGTEIAHERQQVDEVARVRRLADQHPGALAALLERLGVRRGLVVRRDSRCEVRVELPPGDARCVPVDVRGLAEPELLELGALPPR
jgi:hypothetical protein